MSSTITISGVGFSQTVELEDGQNLAVALDEAGVNPDEDGLDVEVNGHEVEDPSTVTPAAGDQVTATPKKVALG